MKRRQELIEEAERQRIKEEMEAKAAAEAAEQAKREAEKRDVVDVAASEEAAGELIFFIQLYLVSCNLHCILKCILSL